jgi:O-antigen ligase
MPITLPWVILIIGVAISLARTVVENTDSGAYRRRIVSLLRSPLAGAIGAFAIAAVLSGFANGGFGEAFQSFVSLRGFVVYFWAYDAFHSVPLLKNRAVACLIFVGAMAGFWAAFQQLTGFHMGSFKYLQGTGFLATPMTFSGTMQIFSLLAIGLLFGGAYRQAGGLLSKPAFLGFSVIGNLVGMIFACERSGWLGFAGGLILAAASLPNRQRLANVAAGLTTLSVLAWLTIPVVKTRFVEDWQHDPSLTFRILVWDHALKVFRAHPLFGIGIRRFPQLAVPASLAPEHAPVLDHAHSNYIHILATLGLFGFACYLYTWWQVIITAWRGFQMHESAEDLPHDPEDIEETPTLERSAAVNESPAWNFDQGLSFGIMAGAIALMLSGLFEYNFGTGQIRLTQWFIFAMLAVHAKNSLRFPSRNAGTYAGSEVVG